MTSFSDRFQGQWGQTLSSGLKRKGPSERPRTLAPDLARADKLYPPRRQAKQSHHRGQSNRPRGLLVCCRGATFQTDPQIAPQISEIGRLATLDTRRFGNTPLDHRDRSILAHPVRGVPSITQRQGPRFRRAMGAAKTTVDRPHPSATSDQYARRGHSQLLAC
jgi:hypothetical protein